MPAARATAPVAACEIGRTYGRPRLQRALRAEGVRIGDQRVPPDAAASWRPRAPALPGHDGQRAPSPVAANHLARPFAVRRRIASWAADITAAVDRRGWPYLAVVLDLASRRVVGWAMRSDLAPRSCEPPSRVALGRPAAPGQLHHSDRGSHMRARLSRQLDTRHHREHESRRRLLGQCPGRKLL